MTDPLVPLAVYDTSSMSWLQFVTGVLVLVAALAALTIGRAKASSAGIDAEEKRVRDYLVGRIESVGYRGLYVHADESRGEWHDRVSDALDDEYDPPATVRKSISDALELTGTRLDAIPSLATRVSGEVVLYVVFGLLVLTPLEVLQRYASATLPSSDNPLGVVVDALMSLAGSYPYAEFVFSLAFAGVYKLWQGMYAHPLAVSGVVVLLVVGLTVLYTRVEEDALPESVGPSRASMLKGVLSLGLATWGSGVLTAGIISPIAPGWSDKIGITVSLSVFTAGIVLGQSVLRAFISDAFRRARSDALTRVYVASSVVVGVVGALLAPVTVAYIVVAISEGRLSAVVSLLLSDASLHVQVVVSAVLLLVTGTCLYAFRDALVVAGEAVRRAFVLRSVRAKIWAGGVPYMVVIAGFGILRGLEVGYAGAFGGAILIGLTVRAAVELVTRVKSRRADRLDRASLPSRLLVEVNRVDLPTEGDWLEYDEVYVARVDGDRELLHPDRETLVDALLDDLDSLFRSGEPTPSIPARMHEDATEYGQLDPEVTRDKLRRRIREAVLGNLRNNDGRLDKSELDERVTEKYPEDVYREELARYRRKGMLDESASTYRLLRS